MAHEITIPRLGWSMEEGKFVGWKKRDGELVRGGDPLFELEGEKAVQDVESVDSGILRIPADAPVAGTVVNVGQVIGYLVAPGELAPWEVDQPTSSAESPAVSSVCFEPPHSTQDLLAPDQSVDSLRDRPRATPRARRAATAAGIDLAKVVGTGRGKRVRERDVLAWSAADSRDDVMVSPPVVTTGVAAVASVLASDDRGGYLGGSSSAATQAQPLTTLRRTIANRLKRSRDETVPVTLNCRADAGNLVGIREQFRAAASAESSAAVPSYTDLIVKLVAQVLVGNSQFAARWSGEQLLIPATFDIGIAVDTEEGLVVPVVRDAARLRLTELTQITRDLAARARTRRLNSAELQGACFTVTNLGSFGIDSFTPVINWPETAILGLGGIRREPVVVADDRIEPRWQMWLSLTFDHRVADGAPAARFLQKIRGAIENPAAWLIG
ncbi:MAG: dihydrolipoamide acetyltransferase family protein [Pirellulales bacterium]